MGLSDILLEGGLMGIKRGIPRAPVDPRTPPFVPPQTSGNPIPLGDAPDGLYNADEQRLRDKIANPPQEGVKPDGSKISGFRRVMGTIAQVAGPLIGGPGVSEIGQRLLNPGADKWNADVQRLQALSQLSQQAEARANLQENRNLARQQAEEARQTVQQNQIRQLTDNNGGAVLPDVDPMAQIKNLPMQPTAAPKPTMPTMVGSPLSQGLVFEPPKVPQVASNPGEMIDPNTGQPASQVGSVAQLPLGKKNVNVLQYKPSVKAGLDAAAAAQKKQSEIAASQTELIDADRAQQLKDLGLKGAPKAGAHVTPAQMSLYVDYIKGRQNSADTLANRPPSAIDEKLKYQSILQKLNAEGALDSASVADSRLIAKAIKGSKVLTPKEKNSGIAYLAANSTPAASGAAATIRVEGFGNIRLSPMLDTRTNQLVTMNANEINEANRVEPGRFVSSAPAMTTISKDSLFKDINYNIRKAKEAVSAMDTFSPETRAQLALALKDPDPKSAIGAFMTGAAGTTMTPQQEDLVIALRQLSENAMAMRSIAGMGQGSDTMRAAIQATLPSARTPTKGYALKQLQQMENVVGNLRQGVPKLGNAPAEPAATAGPKKGDTQSYQGATYTFDGSQWVRN